MTKKLAIKVASSKLERQRVHHEQVHDDQFDLLGSGRLSDSGGDGSGDSFDMKKMDSVIRILEIGDAVENSGLGELAWAHWFAVSQCHRWATYRPYIGNRQ